MTTKPKGRMGRPAVAVKLDTKLQTKLPKWLYDKLIDRIHSQGRIRTAATYLRDLVVDDLLKSGATTDEEIRKRSSS